MCDLELFSKIRSQILMIWTFLLHLYVDYYVVIFQGIVLQISFLAILQGPNFQSTYRDSLSPNTTKLRDNQRPQKQHINKQLNVVLQLMLVDILVAFWLHFSIQCA